MSTSRRDAGAFLDLSDAVERPSGAVDDDFDEFADPEERIRAYAIAEAEERGLWCFVTRQDDAAWHRLTRLERNAMAGAINRAHRRR